MKTLIGYKAFNKGLVCNGFQYELGKEVSIKEKPIRCGNYGFHACDNPLDVLNYYDLCESEFAVVEASGDIDRTDAEDTKFATNKIKVTAKLDLPEFIKASVDFVWNSCSNKGIFDKAKNLVSKASSGDYSQLASSGDSAQLASSGDSAKLASSGDYSKLASSGDYSKLASSGYSAKLASSGYSAKLASSGNYSKLASSGNYSKLASSGDSAQLASSENYSKLASSGDYSKLASSGNYSKLSSSGNSAQLASSGYSAQLASSGNYSKLASSGNYSVVAGIGHQNKAKGKKGNWIVLAEWKYDNKISRYIPICVKSQKIDGKKLKEDTWYILEDKKFKAIK
jgi:hypothetical protein